MSSTESSSRRSRRLTAGISALALLITGAFAFGAQAALAGGAAKVSVTPTSANAGSTTTASFTISNTKTAIKQFTVTAPANLPVTVGATQNGWGSSLNAPNCGTAGQPACIVTYTPDGSTSKYGNGANGSISISLSFVVPSNLPKLTFNFDCYDAVGGNDFFQAAPSITVNGYVPTVTRLVVGAPYTGSGTTTQPFAAGTTVTVPVAAYDATDTLMTSLSATQLAQFTAARVTGTGTFSPSAFTAASSGSASAQFTYTDTVAETMSFSVSYGSSITADNSPTSVQFKPAALTLTVDTVTDLTQTSSVIYSGDNVRLDFSIADAYGNTVTVDGSTSAVTVSVPATASGQFVKTGGGTDYVTGYYTYGETVALTVNDSVHNVSGSTSVTFTKKIATDSGTFVPHVPAAVKTGNTDTGLTTCTTDTACGWADLPNGANGNVSATISGTSTNILEVVGTNGDTTFKDPANNNAPLYTNTAPLPVTFVCGSAVCPTTSMPDNNGTAPTTAIGSTCTVSSSTLYLYGGPFSGTTFGRGSGTYCLFDAPSERVDFAQVFPFSYQLAGQTSPSPLTSSCSVGKTDANGKTYALPLGALNPSNNYANATKIPDLDWAGNPLKACLNVGSIDSVVVGSGSSVDYFVNFQALFADDITLRLK